MIQQKSKVNVKIKAFNVNFGPQHPAAELILIKRAVLKLNIVIDLEIIKSRFLNIWKKIHVEK